MHWLSFCIFRIIYTHALQMKDQLWFIRHKYPWYEYMKCLKIPKWRAESVNRRRTDNTMAKRKRTQGQTMIYKALHRKLKIESHELHLNPRVNTGATEGLPVPAQNIFTIFPNYFWEIMIRKYYISTKYMQKIALDLQSWWSNFWRQLYRSIIFLCHFASILLDNNPC